MRSLLPLLALVAISASVAIPQGKATFLHGAMCQPCVTLITNGENKEEGDFDTWFQAETDKLCSSLGIMKGECKAYFMEKEEEINHFITVKADPHVACHDLDLCDK